MSLINVETQASPDELIIVNQSRVQRAPPTDLNQLDFGRNVDRTGQ